VQGCCPYGAVGVRATITKKADQSKLHVTFSRHPARCNEQESFVQCGLLHASFEDDLGYFKDVARQLAMTNRILGCEFQQRWIVKIVPTLEDDVLMHKIRMLPKIGVQTCCIALIEKFHGTTKGNVFNSCMVG
jgi:hypothetical protein